MLKCVCSWPEIFNIVHLKEHWQDSTGTAEESILERIAKESATL